MLIDAVACSEQLRSECALLIAGSGEASYIKELSARADTAGIAEITRWLGHVEGEEKAATLQAADIFVLPSISENFGIAAVEAMLAGLPCVLSEGVAIAREAENAGAAEITGLAVNQLRLSIERLIENDALRRRLSIRARAFSRERYSAESMGKALVDFYLDIARTA
ncbi:hypothetical protein LMG27198_01260 [Methylocystis echinoides]|uniref:Glycosyl transferase family 1 domain-containing protein n=1 Tax=Methylocystis echinoides TaxID=29468 RepID=A0A9W6LQD7_9HYPH|nr:hypothetical protein LMG27198_01260 [Methylocystis echinoides]